jgi:hypothetical protein
MIKQRKKATRKHKKPDETDLERELLGEGRENNAQRIGVLRIENNVFDRAVGRQERQHILVGEIRICTAAVSELNKNTSIAGLGPGAPCIQTVETRPCFYW